MKPCTLNLTFLFSILVLSLFGCTKKTDSAISNTNASTVMLALGDKAKLVEERVVNGEDVNESDIKGLSTTELRILRNAVFARHGRKYDDDGLGGYFNKRSWYKPRDDYKDTDLTPTDRTNVKTILTLEKSLSPSDTNASTSTPSASSSSSAAPVQSERASGNLTNEKAQDAINKWARSYVGATVRVIGIREMPQENSAQVDLSINNLHWNYDNGYVTQKMGCNSCSGMALFSHYNDGRWILASIQSTAGGWTGINIEAR